MLQLNEDHVYSNEGKILPGVTEIIDSAGLKSSYDSGTTYYLDLGTAIHKLFELYDTDDLGEFLPAYQPYLDNWIKFRKDYKDLDETILDIKTGQKYKWHPIQTAGYQILYEYSRPQGNLIEVRLQSESFAGTIDRAYSSTGRIKKRMVVYVSSEEYKVIEHKNENDLAVFQAALTLYQFKKTRAKNE